MSELATLARPYAEAVFQLAKQSDSAQSWSDMLAFMSAVVSDAELSVIIDNPKVSHQRLIQLLLDICQGQLSKQGDNFLKLLVENNRLSVLSQIATLYEKQRAEDEGYIDVDVLTAFSFTKEEEKKFSASLEKTLNKKVHIAVSVDKSLIGGFLVRAGDKVIDGSIKGQLEHMRKTLQ